MEDSFINYIKYDILADFPEYVYDFVDYLSGTKSRTDMTIKAYARDIKCFYDYLITAAEESDNNDIKKYQDITPEYLRTLKVINIERYMSYLKSGMRKDGKEYSENAIARKRRLSSLRTFMQYLVKHDLIEINVAKLTDTPHASFDKKAPLTDNDVVDMLDSIAIGNIGTENQQVYLERSKLRDYAIILLLVQTGIRVSELVNLDIQDVDFKRKRIRVIRKGQKQDYVLLNDEVVDAIQDYIENERFNKDDVQDALFLSSRSQNNTRLCVRSVQNIVKKFGSVTKNIKVSPHTLRRTFGTKLYEICGDDFLVAHALGHENLQSLRNYITIGSARESTIRNISYYSDNE